jgi:Ser/Thr protein kinase RdoA (MazF antagonist)
VLRRVHRLAGRRFGPLLADGGSWATACERADARCDELVRQDLLAGGSGELCGRVRRFVDRYHDAISTCTEPVLCHDDANGGNVLVTATGEPEICGVVDLERASWDDPLCDLARTRQHVRHHDPGGVASVTAAYGVAEEGERLRLDVHELLHVLEERTWIVHDRPVGWQRSVAALEQQLWQRT